MCTIKPTEKNRSGRCYNKRQSCYYCEKLVSSISHHLECSHGNEPEVARILALKPLTEKCPLKKKSLIAERKRLFGILRNRGNHQHNIGVLEKGEGEVILMRRPTSDFNVDDFGPCPDCQGWLVKTRMWDHQHYHCIGREHVKGKNELLNESDVLAGKYSHASPQLKNIVFPSMKRDSITTIAKNDCLIVALGDATLAKNVRNKLRRKHYASDQMRQAARLLDSARRIDGSDGDISTFLKPSKFDIVCSAARTMATGSEDADDEGDEMTHPSSSTRIGFVLKKLISFKQSRALKDGDAAHVKEASDFLKVFNIEWQTRVAAEAACVLENRNLNKIEELPDIKDIMTLGDYLKREIRQQLITCQQTECVISHQEFRRLQELVLVRLLTFNRRRPGELEQLL